MLDGGERGRARAAVVAGDLFWGIVFCVVLGKGKMEVVGWLVGLRGWGRMLCCVVFCFVAYLDDVGVGLGDAGRDGADADLKEVALMVGGC